jgi:hypothetical protein
MYAFGYWSEWLTNAVPSKYTNYGTIHNWFNLHILFFIKIVLVYANV